MIKETVYWKISYKKYLAYCRLNREELLDKGCEVDFYVQIVTNKLKRGGCKNNGTIDQRKESLVLETR